MYEEIGKIVKLMNYREFNWKNDRLDSLMSKREAGDQFVLRDHVESLVLSLLSANRPWYGIVRNMENLKRIFHDYDPEYLLQANPEELITAVCSIDCGNKRIAKQMEELSWNIRVLQSVEGYYGDIDALAKLATNEPKRVMTMLSMNGGTFKLKGVGKALALEYLKGVGVDAVKPDVHIRRILQRFGYFNYLPSEEETFDLVQEMSNELNMKMHEIGSILWTFCATGYLEICGNSPKCSMCTVCCPCSTADESAIVDLRIAVYWYNYLMPFEDKMTEVTRLTTLYGTYDVKEIVMKMLGGCV